MSKNNDSKEFLEISHILINDSKEFAENSQTFLELSMKSIRKAIAEISL